MSAGATRSTSRKGRPEQEVQRQVATEQEASIVYDPADRKECVPMTTVFCWLLGKHVEYFLIVGHPCEEHAKSCLHLFLASLTLKWGAPLLCFHYRHIAILVPYL